MPVLKRTDHLGVVVWLGVATAERGTLRSAPLETVELGFQGITGARHEGENRASCVRVRNLYPDGTTIRNTRQLTILSSEELDGIASELGLAALDPGLIGASVVLRGIPDLSHLPPSSRLQGRSGVTLTVDLENRPCVYPAHEIEAEEPGHGKAFLSAARGRRGLTAWVERPGVLALGDEMRLFVPDQRAWAP